MPVTPQPDLLEIFKKFPEVYETCREDMENELGQGIQAALQLDNQFKARLKEVISAAKQIHLSTGWSLALEEGEGFAKLNAAMTSLYLYMGSSKI